MKIVKLEGSFLIQEVLNVCGAERIECLQEATLEPASNYEGFAYKIVHPEKQEEINEVFKNAKPFMKEQNEENVILNLKDLATFCLTANGCYCEEDSEKAERNAYFNIMKDTKVTAKLVNYQKMRENAQMMGKIANKLEVLDAIVNPLKDEKMDLSIEEFNSDYGLFVKEQHVSVSMDRKSCFWQYLGVKDIQTFLFSSTSISEEIHSVDFQHCAGILEGVHGESLIVTIRKEQGEFSVITVDLYTGNDEDTGELLSEEYRVLIENYLDKAIKQGKEIMEGLKK